ncbi:transcriptional regulator [Pasteurellaceae bacterium RH1A]|nr:transcriptional regulator [Pasteurellaceae bacterium RH1A]
MNVQYINSPAGKPEFVVLPVADYEEIARKARFYDEEEGLEEEWESIPVEPSEDGSDDVTIPHDVVFLQFEHNVNLLGAWRIYRNLSQAEVAEKTGLTQSAISQAERKGSKPQKRTREKLAKIYNCLPEQLVL